MQQTDAVLQTEGVDSIPIRTINTKRVKELTPAQILKRLPKDATPAQQDSAVQVNINPCKIHWSTQPDTLHLPGQPVPNSYRNFKLSPCYKESFFVKSTFFHPELKGGRAGVAGDPVPYTIANDNLVTGMLLVCFILGALALSNSYRFIARQLKNFFYQPQGKTTVITETASEIRSQFFFVLQTCLLFSLIVFFYTRAQGVDSFIIEHYQVIAIYTGGFLSYFLCIGIAYWFGNWVFFERKKNEQWMKSKLFLIAIEGVALFPIVMLQSYFDVAVQSAIVYTAIIISLIKILTLYKLYAIFFRQRGSLLQIILYFCALEVIPMFIMWGVFEVANDYLKVNY